MIIIDFRNIFDLKKQGQCNCPYHSINYYFKFQNKEDLEKSVVKERAQWGNSLEFLMSCIAMSVGLGNIWRFPFTAYENGGGAFLIPYILTLLLIGRPMYYLEMVLGQFTSRGNLQMFRTLGPGFHGKHP